MSCGKTSARQRDARHVPDHVAELDPAVYQELRRLREENKTLQDSVRHNAIAAERGAMSRSHEAALQEQLAEQRRFASAAHEELERLRPVVRQVAAYRQTSTSKSND